MTRADDTQHHQSGASAFAPGPVRQGRWLRELGPFGAFATRVGAAVTGRKTVGVFATLGRAPRLFRGWLIYSAMMMPFGYLNRRESELVILRVASLRGSAYELDQHRVIATKQAKIAARTVAAVVEAPVGAVTEAQNPAAPEFPGQAELRALSARERALLAGAEDLVKDRLLSDPVAAALAAELTPRERVAFVALVTQYDGLATVLDVLDVPVDPRR